jgi:transcriptional regulator with XRE-family HTH domain
MNEDEPYFKLRMEASLKNGLLKEARINLGLSQKEVAKNLGISQIMYSQIERMQRYPEEGLLESICDFYKLNPTQVFPEQLRSVPFQKVYVASKTILPSQLESMTDEHHLLAESIESTLEQDDLKKQIELSLGILTKRDADIIKRVYGLTPYDEPQTTSNIAKVYSVSDTTIRKVSERSLRKIRYSKNERDKLKVYLG